MLLFAPGYVRPAAPSKPEDRTSFLAAVKHFVALHCVSVEHENPLRQGSDHVTTSQRSDVVRLLDEGPHIPKRARRDDAEQ
jgi:hypothetical protein